jgi:signal transduction histidine kinase
MERAEARLPTIPLGEDAVILLDRDGAIVGANGATETLFGSPAMRSLSEIVARLDADEATILRPPGSGDRSPIQVHGMDPASWLDVAIHPMPDVGNRQPTRILVARDVSAMQRARVLREAFASVVSHELRTPVTTIYGGAQLMADPAISDHTRDDAAAAVATEAERLYRLVEDLVVLARFDQPITVGDDPVLLQRFVPALVADEAARSDGRVRVHMDDDLPAVIGRQGYVEQVLRHFLTNAIRLSSRTDDVLLSAEQIDGSVDVSVIDSGPTIGADESAVLFDLFHRSARTLNDSSGANISLFICRRLIEAMGGTVWARPRDGRVDVGFSLRVARDAD